MPYRDELAAFVARLNRLYVLEETEPATEAESEMYDDFGDYGDFGDFGDFRRYRRNLYGGGAEACH